MTIFEKYIHHSNILSFISRFRNEGTIDTFTNGCCYWFAYILCSRFSELTIMYDAVANHFVAGYDGRLYDITGNVTGKYNVVAWYDYCDEAHKQRIVDCCIKLIK